MSDATPDRDVPTTEAPPEGSDTSEQVASHPDAAGEVVVVEGEGLDPETITEPAKLMRIASMVRELLEETRQASLDEAGPSPPPCDLRPLRGRAARGSCPRTCRKNCRRLLPRWRGSPANRRSGSRRHSSSAGSKACSTGSRRRCSRSKRPLARSSTRSAGGAVCPGSRKSCRPARAVPGQYL